MNNSAKGFGISFVFHGAVLFAIMSMGSLLPAADIVKIIDFSLVERPAPVRKKSSKRAPALKAPPAMESVVSRPLAPKFAKISVPVQEKELVPVKEANPPPEPVMPDPVVAENIIEEAVETEEAPVEHETTTADNLAEESTGPVSGPTGQDVADLEVARGQYVKANLHYIKNNIQKSISYPRIARKMGWEGKVVVSFVVDEEGMVHEVRIVKSSGFAALDKNAIATIKKAAPFRCPPVRAELVVPVIYRLA